MASSSVRSFTDPHEYAGSIRQGRVELTVTERGQYRAQLVRIDLHRLWMQRFSEDLARIKHTDGLGGRAVIAFPTQSRTRQSWNSVELDTTNIIRHKAGSSYYQRATGTTSYGAMSLTLADMASVGTAIAGCDLAPPVDTKVTTPSPAAMAKLQQLHAAAGQLAETAPDVIANPDMARGLEQALIEAMVRCLITSDTAVERSSQRRHELIMRRFHRMIEDHPDEAVYIPEVCKAIGVPERTLRLICTEHLGMSPKHYLLLRRMNFVRRDLQRVASRTTTVTDVAAQYGFWNFGRFAGEYKSMFGELPSDTLKQARL